MTTYKEIHGTNIEVLASDPANPIEGQIWYNTTTQVLEGYALVAGSWATAGPLNTGRESLGGAGTQQTAALAFAGYDGTNVLALTESYNGTAWTELNDMNTARRLLGGCGATDTAALAFGGLTTVNVGNNESWNGTSWTEVNDLNTARREFTGSIGTNTAALAVGQGANNESWNGTSWTEVNDLNTSRRQGVGTGIQAAGLVTGGETTPGAIVGNTESWNGTSWTEVNDLNTARWGSMAGAGTQTASLCAGGLLTASPTFTGTGITELWNGISWTEVNDLNTARSAFRGAGTQTAALAFGGQAFPGGARVASTEEWSGPAVQSVAITTS